MTTATTIADLMSNSARFVLFASLAFTLAFGVAAPVAAQPRVFEVPKDLEIVLERTLCAGPCPVYTVAIDRQGVVFFHGQQNVRVVGPQTARIPMSRVEQLMATALSIHFFEMPNYYRASQNADGTPSVTIDHPTTAVTISGNGIKKRVENHLGAPDEFVQFARAIDEAAGTKEWIYFDQATLAQLLQSGWSASGYEGTKLLQDAIGRNDIEVARTLIEAGADMNGLPENRTPALISARSAEMVELLAKAGADPNERPVDKLPAWTPLMFAAQKDAAVAQALLKAGARLEDLEDGRSALWYAACQGNWQVVEMLLRAGANIRGAANMSAVDCARNARRNVADRPREPLDRGVPTVEDFDRVIALLDSAAVRAKQ